MNVNLFIMSHHRSPTHLGLVMHNPSGGCNKCNTSAITSYYLEKQYNPQSRINYSHHRRFVTTSPPGIITIS